MAYGVGIIGAGPGAEAVHLPTLDRLDDRFRVVHVADAGSGRAARLAAPRGARASSDVGELLADPAVEVVAICSPPGLHAVHALAAVAAGVRGILIEKPLALSVADAVQVVEACREAGVALVVGTNHLYDPAWGRVTHHLLASGAPVRTVTVSVGLPPNGPLHAAVTEPSTVPAGPRAAPDLSDARVAAGMVTQIVQGLLVHDLPLVRDLAPDLERVIHAAALAPAGCVVGFRAGDVLVQLAAVLLPSGADPEWRMTVVTAAERVDIAFPPSFVHAGSAQAVVTAADGRITAYPRDPDDGYVAEWRALADRLDGAGETAWAEMVDDARYVLALADQAGRWAATAQETHSPAASPIDASAPTASRRPDPSGVVVVDEGFRIAAQGLPVRLRLVDAQAGAIAAGVVRADAAVVVLRAGDVPVDAAASPPLVAVRTHLRPDVVADALEARGPVSPRVVIVECAAAGPDDPALADAVGWVRRLAGGPVTLVARDRTEEAVVASLRAGGVMATLTATFGGSSLWLRVRAIGETTVEVVVDAAGRATVSSSTAAGTRTAPVRWESAEREALRRATDVAAGALASDLADLVHDRARVRSIIDGVDGTDRQEAGSPPVAG